MEGYVIYFLIFMAGMLFGNFWSYILGLGNSTIMMRAAIIDCLIVLAKNIQTCYEVSEIKSLALKVADKDDKYIEFQQNLDEKEIKSLKNTVIRNFINSVPTRYNRMVPFHNWETAMNFLNISLKQEIK